MPWFLIHSHLTGQTDVIFWGPRCSFCRTWLSRASKGTSLQPMGFPGPFAWQRTKDMLKRYVTMKNDMKVMSRMWYLRDICICAYFEQVMNHQKLTWNQASIICQSFKSVGWKSWLQNAKFIVLAKQCRTACLCTLPFLSPRRSDPKSMPSCLALFALAPPIALPCHGPKAKMDLSQSLVEKPTMWSWSLFDQTANEPQSEVGYCRWWTRGPPSFHVFCLEYLNYIFLEST